MINGSKIKYTVSYHYFNLEKKYNVGEENFEKKPKLTEGFYSSRPLEEPKLNLDMINLILRPENQLKTFRKTKRKKKNKNRAISKIIFKNKLLKLVICLI